MMRTLHVLYAGRYGSDREIVSVSPTRAAAEADIVHRVLSGVGGGALAEGAEIIELQLPETPAELAGRKLADLWERVTPTVSEAVDTQCGGLVELLDRLAEAVELPGPLTRPVQLR